MTFPIPDILKAISVYREIWTRVCVCIAEISRRDADGCWQALRRCAPRDRGGGAPLILPEVPFAGETRGEGGGRHRKRGLRRFGGFRCPGRAALGPFHRTPSFQRFPSAVSAILGVRILGNLHGIPNTSPKPSTVVCRVPYTILARTSTQICIPSEGTADAAVRVAPVRDASRSALSRVCCFVSYVELVIASSRPLSPDREPPLNLKLTDFLSGSRETNE
ncbi:hypothetical protein BT67DRAFT_209625 [Trichocladium antarcticum]|uniref:Uncharacterized protein n=1 Tax=Trichocladium antarcticum TaxID=1450529 RepID=A0AAN6ZA68_9PEZI|nr:hypothetical protein BT67DRAFT_209625 [Trichocladium antarcticum]